MAALVTVLWLRTLGAWCLLQDVRSHRQRACVCIFEMQLVVSVTTSCVTQLNAAAGGDRLGNNTCTHQDYTGTRLDWDVK